MPSRSLTAEEVVRAESACWDSCCSSPSSCMQEWRSEVRVVCVS
jgi:hypothetical protein